MRIKQFGEFLRSWDIFGHQISLHHKGDGSYKTILGFFISAVVFSLIVSNLVTLTVAFADGSR